MRFGSAIWTEPNTQRVNRQSIEGRGGEDSYRDNAFALGVDGVGVTAGFDVYLNRYWLAAPLESYFTQKDPLTAMVQG